MEVLTKQKSYVLNFNLGVIDEALKGGYMKKEDKFNCHIKTNYTLYIHMRAPRFSISVRCNLVLNTTDCITDMCAMQSVEADGYKVDKVR